MKFKLNENKTELTLVESTREEYNQLKLSLSKFVKNYFFMARFKLTPWDGKISFLRTGGKIHFGLWHEIYKICKEYGYPFIIENKELFPVDKTVVKEKIKEFTDYFYRDHKDKDDLKLYGINPQSIPNKYRWSEMTPEQRNIMKAQILDRADALDHWDVKKLRRK